MQQATTIKRFRSHPLYIVSILWKYLFILLVPVIRGLYYVIINSFSLENGFQFAVNISNWAKGAWMDIVFLLGFLSLGVLLWLSFTIEVSEEGLLIKRGVLKREVRFLPVSRYNCLSVVSPMSVRLFGGVYLRVDTPGGGLKQADLLMMLRTKDCRQIIKLLQLPDSLEQPAHTRSYTPKNRYVFVLAMVTSNSFAGVLLISTFVTQAGNILGEQFSEMLYGTFENVTRTLAFGVPPAAFALACILFFGYLCAFVVSLSRHANFHVIRRKNLLEVRAGLLTKRSYRIAADKIAYLDIRRSLLTCLLVLGGVPFFLPKMHERYTFGADVLALAIAAYNPKRVWLPLLFGLSSYICYTAGLPGDAIFDLKWATVFQGAAVALTAAALYRSLNEEKAEAALAEVKA